VQIDATEDYKQRIINYTQFTELIKDVITAKYFNFAGFEALNDDEA
jgi:hypothetical protein